MLQNAYLLANIGADTAENEQDFAEILPIGRHLPEAAAGAAAPAPNPRLVVRRLLLIAEGDEPIAPEVASLLALGC